MKNPAIPALICKGILTLADLHELQCELQRLAYEKWEQAGKPEGKDKEFHDAAEREYFRYHFIGDAQGHARETFGLHCRVNEWK